MQTSMAARVEAMEAQMKAMRDSFEEYKKNTDQRVRAQALHYSWGSLTESCCSALLSSRHGRALRCVAIPCTTAHGSTRIEMDPP